VVISILALASLRRLGGESDTHPFVIEGAVE